MLQDLPIRTAQGGLVMFVCCLFQGLTVPAHVQEVLEEEFNKLSFLDNHSSEFR